MRHEPICDNVTIAWRDERQGRSEVHNETQLKFVLEHFGFKDIDPVLPLEVENEEFTVICQDDAPPWTVVVHRKPQGKVQAAAWDYAAQTRMAKIVFQDGEFGVLFRDENTFVPFSRLRYDSKSGFSII